MLHDRLRIMRERRKLTQEYVAKYLEITRPAYTQYESGRRVPSPVMLAKLAKLYGVTTDYLITGKESVMEKDMPGGKDVVNTEKDKELQREVAEELKWHPLRRFIEEAEKDSNFRKIVEDVMTLKPSQRKILKDIMEILDLYEKKG